eukprot:TRINITY_DN12563_c0_g1_i1.p1 TRINITY_DN12563_c0_g1~~TRINITY_DN12563_c0_g1_i1.p1  ORF type:complete len:800 (-),score=170.38 TRINITY_DN12563_c0_g1_i1:67-2466(-)
MSYHGLANDIFARKPKRRVDWLQKRLREEFASPGSYRDLLYEVLTRKEGRSLTQEFTGADASRVYTVLVDFMDVFTARQQRVLKDPKYVLRQLHMQEEEEQAERRKQKQELKEQRRKEAKQQQPESDGLRETKSPGVANKISIPSDVTSFTVMGRLRPSAERDSLPHDVRSDAGVAGDTKPVDAAHGDLSTQTSDAVNDMKPTTESDGVPMPVEADSGSRKESDKTDGGPGGVRNADGQDSHDQVTQSGDSSSGSGDGVCESGKAANGQDDVQKHPVQLERSSRNDVESAADYCRSDEDSIDFEGSPGPEASPSRARMSSPSPAANDTRTQASAGAVATSAAERPRSPPSPWLSLPSPLSNTSLSLPSSPEELLLPSSRAERKDVSSSLPSSSGVKGKDMPSKASQPVPLVDEEHQSATPAKGARRRVKVKRRKLRNASSPQSSTVNTFRGDVAGDEIRLLDAGSGQKPPDMDSRSGQKRVAPANLREDAASTALKSRKRPHKVAKAASSGKTASSAMPAGDLLPSSKRPSRSRGTSASAAAAGVDLVMVPSSASGAGGGGVRDAAARATASAGAVAAKAAGAGARGASRAAPSATAAAAPAPAGVASGAGALESRTQRRASLQLQLSEKRRELEELRARAAQAAAAAAAAAASSSSSSPAARGGSAGAAPRAGAVQQDFAVPASLSSPELVAAAAPAPPARLSRPPGRSADAAAALARRRQELTEESRRLEELIQQRRRRLLAGAGAQATLGAEQASPAAAAAAQSRENSSAASLAKKPRTQERCSAASDDVDLVVLD